MCFGGGVDGCMATSVRSNQIAVAIASTTNHNKLIATNLNQSHLNQQHDELEAEYEKELAALEAKYEALYGE